jgi:hypothetical protein
LAARRGLVGDGRLATSVLVALVLLGLIGLWLPGPLGAALAPLAAVVAALPLAALGRAWRARGAHAPAA